MTLHRLLRDIKRIGYDKKTSVKIMDDDNRDIAIFIITHMLNTSRAIIIQGDDGKNMLPSLFRSMGLVGVILSEKMIQHLIPDYKMTRAEYSMEDNFPMYLTFNKKTGRHVSFLRVRRSDQPLLGWISASKENDGRNLFIFWSASF
jgi:hypothetical protein